MPIKTRWPDVVYKIKECVETPEFEEKNRKVIFDSQIGIVGWKGKRNQDDSPKILDQKGSLYVASNSNWKSHVKEFGTKVKNKPKKIKFIFVHLGIAAHELEKEPPKEKATSKKRKESNATPDLNSSKVSLVSMKNAKKKKKDRFVAPTTLIVDVLAPVEFDAKDEANKTSRIDLIGSIDVDFERCVIGRHSDEITSDVSSDSIDSSSIEIVNDNDDDVIVSHFYDSLSHVLIHDIVSNQNGKHEACKDKIGKKVRVYFISCFSLLKFN